MIHLNIQEKPSYFLSCRMTSQLSETADFEVILKNPFCFVAKYVFIRGSYNIKSQLLSTCVCILIKNIMWSTASKPLTSLKSNGFEFTLSNVWNVTGTPVVSYSKTCWIHFIEYSSNTALHVFIAWQCANMFRNRLSQAEITCFSSAISAVYSALAEVNFINPAALHFTVSYWRTGGNILPWNRSQ